MSIRISHLNHLLLRGVLLVAGCASLLFGLLFLGLYRDQLVRERAEVSLQLNRMLQVTWENAMLKRDVDGLRDIVAKLGGLVGIQDVLILSPSGEVRFASDIAKLGLQMVDVTQATPDGKPVSRFEKLDSSGEVLRSINPLRNRAQCTQCHGPVVEHPVNGLLIIDYDAGPIRERAWRSAVLFLVSGTAVLALTLLTLWLLLRRHVIAPLADLDTATHALAAGDLGVRARQHGNNEIGRAVASFNNMAERLAQQIALAESHQRYLQYLLDALPDGVRVIRAGDMQVTLANQAFCQQMNERAEAILGRSCYRCSHGRNTPCVSTLVICPVDELKEVGDSIKVYHHHQRADGSQFPAEVHAALVEIDNGSGPERYIVESVRDLGQVARVSHEQRLSELGLLAAGIAHEIHNPLGSVRLGVQGLAREIKSGLVTPGQIADYMGLIDQEIDNCIAVTRRLLLLARPPSSQLQLVTLNTSLADTVRLLEFDAQNRHIEQKLELPDKELRILADEAEIRMIILNLVQNAHHAMPDGGTLTARLSGDDGEACLEIIDTGIGMTQEQVNRIFDPFFSRRADGVDGTGLGLMIVKNFAERMGCKVSVESGPGVGSHFRVSLPLAEAILKKRS